MCVCKCADPVKPQKLPLIRLQQGSEQVHTEQTLTTTEGIPEPCVSHCCSAACRVVLRRAPAARMCQCCAELSWSNIPSQLLLW